MQVKKITAKIRDMVKISLMENGDERAWYNNIELPDAIKEMEMKDFRFNVLTDSKIEFQITFEPGTLPKTFPEKKARRHRNNVPASTATQPQKSAPSIAEVKSTIPLSPKTNAKPASKKQNPATAPTAITTA